MTFYERAKELVSKMTLAEKISQMKHEACAIPRLGIPAYNWCNECLHGVARSGTATVFPQAIAMAASFHPEKLQEVAQAISDEARAKYNEYRKFGDTDVYQGLTFWSPNINIFRDPRWGRGHETYGEDPYLTARMGTAFIQGLQGEGKYRKVDATIKHYAVHSGPEGLRHEFDAKVDQKDLYDTYLFAFRYCIEHADPSAVMGAYNRTNGEPCCASKTLLERILRQDFGFDGYVVSDCWAICDINRHHHVTETEAQSAALAVNNGCDLNCGNAYEWLKTAVASGLVSEEAITKAVERLFTARFRLGMFDTDCEYDTIPYEVIDCEKHRKLNREMARESIVLLKNDGILPLRKEQKVAVIGPAADDRNVLLGNYNGRPFYWRTYLEGIADYATQIYYAKGCLYSENEVDQSGEKPLREALIAAKKADVVLLCLGLNSSMEGEEGIESDNSQLSGDKLDLELPKCQKELYEQIKALGKPMIFINTSGSCVNLQDQDASCSAVIQCFYPGAEGGRALADILYGQASPSGRLPVTFYRSAGDLPPFEDYSMKNRAYKFFKGPVVYPFGHGLTYSNITEDWAENTVVVKNHGPMDTWYTVLQFEYIPHKNLKNFKKIFLSAGEEKRIHFDECEV